MRFVDLLSSQDWQQLSLFCFGLSIHILRGSVDFTRKGWPRWTGLSYR